MHSLALWQHPFKTKKKIATIRREATPELAQDSGPGPHSRPRPRRVLGTLMFGFISPKRQIKQFVAVCLLYFFPASIRCLHSLVGPSGTGIWHWDLGEPSPRTLVTTSIRFEGALIFGRWVVEGATVTRSDVVSFSLFKAH